MPTLSRAPQLTLLAALLVSLTACDPRPAPVAHPDSVHIQSAGLPAELEPDLTLVTPTGQALSLSESQRLYDAAPGGYSLTAHPRQYGVTTFTAEPSTVTGTLLEGLSLTLSAAYAPDRAALQAALTRLNEYRVASGLTTLTGAPDDSLPHWLHARYAANNRTFGHFEDPALPWHTAEGHHAAQTSNLSYSWRLWPANGTPPSDPFPRTGRNVVDGLAAAPYHMFNMLAPHGDRLRFAWFGTQHDLGDWHEARSVAALQVTTSTAWPAGAIVQFPGAGSTIEINTFWSESPNPLANCPGYTAPAGLPLFVMTGPPGGTLHQLPNGDGHHQPNPAPRITSTTFARNGTPLEHCSFDSASDVNGPLYTHHYGAIVLIPRHPLEPSSTYQVRFETDQGTFAWAFDTASGFVERAGVLVID